MPTPVQKMAVTMLFMRRYFLFFFLLSSDFKRETGGRSENLINPSHSDFSFCSERSEPSFVTKSMARSKNGLPVSFISIV